MKSTRIFKPRHAEGSFLPFHEFLTFGNLHNIIKRFGPRYTPDIQRWNSNPTVQVLPSIFGQDCVPFIFRFYYKSFQTSFFSLFIRVYNFRAFISPHSSYLHKRDFKDPPETRRPVHILLHVSFVLRTSSIFSANLLG